MMNATVTAVLRKALIQLEKDRQEIDQKIAGIRTLIDVKAGGRRATAARRSPARPKAKRRRMSAAARRAVSQRMKAYWAARKGAVAKAKEKKA